MSVSPVVTSAPKVQVAPPKGPSSQASLEHAAPSAAAPATSATARPRHHDSLDAYRMDPPTSGVGLIGSIGDLGRRQGHGAGQAFTPQVPVPRIYTPPRLGVPQRPELEPR